MKKLFLALLMFFAFNTNAFAVAYNTKITGCTNTKQNVSFRVDNGGWYYVSVPFYPSLNGWYLLTTWQTFSGAASGGNSKSFFVVTDMQTNTPVVGKCL
jgi:hypothetical protein